MKKFSLVKKLTVFAVCFAVIPLFAAEEPDYIPYELDKLIHNIERPCEPVITDDYIIFTADTSNRFVGIAFDFENYQTIHPFKLLQSINEDGKKTPKHLFYCYERTHKISSIRYRLIIDGLWTTDPLNPLKEYDDTVNLEFSYVQAPEVIKQNT